MTTSEQVDFSRPFAIAGQWVKEGVVPGAAIAIARHGVLIGAYAGGKQSAGAGRPVEAETLYSIASVTKPYTATLFMRLVEQGLVGLDEAVRRVVPAFTGAGKRDVTFRDLLCHTAGLSKDDPDEAELWAAEADFDRIVVSAAALPLASPPGERVAYSNVAYWLLGAAIATITGQSFIAASRAEVLEPFGLRETLIDPPEETWDRIARRYGRAKIMNAPYGRALGPPSAGLFATARDMTRFASVFLAGGVTPEGERVLSTATATAMINDQTEGQAGGIETIREWPRAAWGLGWEIKGDKLDHWTGDFTSARTFAHPGQSGALLWGDPESGLAVAVLANRDLSTGWSLAPARWARLNNAIVAAATRRETR